MKDVKSFILKEIAHEMLDSNSKKNVKVREEKIFIILIIAAEVYQLFLIS